MVHFQVCHVYFRELIFPYRKKKKTLALELKGKTVIISPGPERAMLMKMEFAAEVAEVALP